MKNQILSLDEKTAKIILSETILHLKQNPEFSFVNSASDEIISSLEHEFGAFYKEEKISEADLVYSSLLLLANTPSSAGKIRELIANPPKSKGIITSAVILSCVLISLQTNIKFNREKNGKWSLSIEVIPTNEKTLKLLVEGLLDKLPRMPFGKR